jgi:pyruvate kinase
VADRGHHVILTRGDHMNAHGGTNTLKILEV